MSDELKAISFIRLSISSAVRGTPSRIRGLSWTSTTSSVWQP
jgi:hypothetical protein